MNSAEVSGVKRDNLDFRACCTLIPIQLNIIQTNSIKHTIFCLKSSINYVQNLKCQLDVNIKDFKQLISIIFDRSSSLIYSLNIFYHLGSFIVSF